MPVNNLQHMIWHLSVPPFAKGGFGGISDQILPASKTNPPQSPFCKGGGKEYRK